MSHNQKRKIHDDKLTTEDDTTNNTNKIMM